MPSIQNLALVFVFALGALLIGWYLVGNEMMRRRGRSLALWCKRSLDPLGGRQAVQWITTQSFRLEVFRPRSVLAADARKYSMEERWTETALDGFRLASVGGPAMEKIARQLIAELGDETPNLIRLAIRRRGLHLTLAMNVPERARLTPERFSQIIDRLARALLRFATPTP